jgi:hypothetical protein
MASSLMPKSARVVRSIVENLGAAFEPSPSAP